MDSSVFLKKMAYGYTWRLMMCSRWITCLSLRVDTEVDQVNENCDNWRISYSNLNPLINTLHNVDRTMHREFCVSIVLVMSSGLYFVLKTAKTEFTFQHKHIES